MDIIILAQEVSMGQGVTPDEGEPIRERILRNLRAAVPTVIDFEGINLITTAFLNVVIGTLYKDYDSEQLKSLLSFQHLTPGISSRIKRVTDNAKSFYKNEADFNGNVDSAIYGND